MKNTFIVLLVIATFALNIQSIYAAEEAVSPEGFRRTGEQFDNNDNKWEVFNTTMASARIEDGKYYIENKSETGELFILHHADFPLGKEFVIETAIKTIKASDNHAYGFVMGASDASNSYVFQIVGDKAYAIMKIQMGDPLELSSGKIRKTVFKKDAFNALKMEKMGSKIRFYLNNYYIDEISDVTLFGKRVGFYVEGKSEIAVDYTRSQIWSE
jgi:hypothetical protein